MIEKRKLNRNKIDQEIDSSTGLSYNGTTHTGPTKVKGELERYYLDVGEGLSTERKKAMVKHQDIVLKMTPDDQKEKAKKQIAIWKKELDNL